MFFFLIPLVFGFACNLASAFTAAYSRRWGEKRGLMVTVVLRDILGIPVWALGFVLACRAPSPVLFASTVPIGVLGWSWIAVGAVIILLALFSIRSKAAKPSMKDVLVQGDLYAVVRHPIHSGTFLEFVGLFFLRPTLAVALACALGCVWIFVQTKFEEIDLVQRMPDYRSYMKRVPRFLPRFRKGGSE